MAGLHQNLAYLKFAEPTDCAQEIVNGASVFSRAHAYAEMETRNWIPDRQIHRTNHQVLAFGADLLLMKH